MLLQRKQFFFSDPKNQHMARNGCFIDSINSNSYFQLVFSDISQSDRCVKQAQAPASQQFRLFLR